MKKKKAKRTLSSIIQSVIRGRIWRFSQVRRERLQIDKHTCQDCGRKDGTIIVHHLKPINWERIIKVLEEEILVPTSELVTLCGGRGRQNCHYKRHHGI